jgi:hypothetical protein
VKTYAHAVKTLKSTGFTLQSDMDPLEIFTFVMVDPSQVTKMTLKPNMPDDDNDWSKGSPAKADDIMYVIR